MCKNCLDRSTLEYQMQQLAEQSSEKARVLRNAIIGFLGGEEKDSILDNGYKLSEMRGDLAEELEHLDPNDKLDKEYIDVNRKLSEALRLYIKAHYGECVLYSDDDDE